MVDTIKFSQMPSGGDLSNNEKTPGLFGGANVLFNNPWTFLPPGSTAQRPVPSSATNYRLRFNTDVQLYEYYDAILGAWTQLQESAFTQGPFVIYKADASIPDGQNLGALTNGILKQTITLGVATLDIALNGTDYYGPGFVIPPASGGTGINNGTKTIDLGSPTTGYVLTSDASGNATWQSVSAGGGVTTLAGDSGSATPTAGVITISGGSTGLTTTGSGSTLSLGGLLNSTFGGLGVSNPTAHGILIGEGASPVTPIVLGAGQILIGTTASDPVAAAINSGTNILVQNSSGSITIGITGTIGVTNGGTGLASVTAHNLLIGNDTSPLTLLAPSATAGVPLISQGSSADPAYGTALVPGGGTGLTSATAYAVLCGGTTSTGAFQSIAGVGSIGQVLTSNGPGALPTFQNVTGTGTVNSGTAGQLAYYATTGTAVSGGQLGNIAGTTTNDNAAAGNVGEFKSSVVPIGSAVTLTTSGVPVDITSISLTAGDWDVWGNVGFTGNGIVGASGWYAWTSATSATQPDLSLASIQVLTASASTTLAEAVPYQRYSLASTTTIYLTGEFAAGAVTSVVGFGGIYARRVR